MNLFNWLRGQGANIPARPYVPTLDAEVDVERLDISKIERVSDKATQFVLHDCNSFVIKCSQDCHDYFIMRFRAKLQARKTGTI